MNEGGVNCPRISHVSHDIENTLRDTVSTMGCYELPPKKVNARLTEITGLREGLILYQTDSVNVTVRNTGSTPLTSINLEWSVNGITQNAGGSNYFISLSLGESATIYVGTITYTASDMDVKVWINHLNGGAVTDEFIPDDTVSQSLFICLHKYSGSLTLGANPTNDFQTFTQFYEKLNLCGASGDITLTLDSGLYAGNLDFSNNTAWMSNHTLTIVSATNNAKDVIIRPSSGIGILLNNTQNLILKDITLDARTSNTNAIEFTGACSDIVVRDCELLVDTTATATICPIYKANSTAVVDNIYIINNLLDGGYYGFYFYGGTGSGQFGTNVIFDSNTVSNQYSAGIYSNYVDFTSCSYNTILSRTANTGSSWYGLSMYASNGSVTGNRIIQRSTAITEPYGIYSNYHNYYLSSNQNRGLIVNNEIILNTTADAFGISVENSKSEILHNSIHISGTGAARGIDILNSAENNMTLKNNNIVVTSSTAYPIYFSATGNLNLYDIDYNNYYAPTNIGYYGGDVTTMSAWQTQITTDQHSVNVLPDFIDVSVSLELTANNSALSCPATGILTDLRKIKRPIITTMGAYTALTNGQDLLLMQISTTEIANNQTVPVNVDLFNLGTVPVTGATLGWSVNGAIQQTAVPFTLSPPLNSLEQKNVTVGSFQAINANRFNIVVWIETVNGQQETINWNDTLSITAGISSLAEFVAPVEDTISLLAFDVSAKIRSVTGAPANTPELHIETVVNNAYTLYDTIPMSFVNGLWQANIPPQYYNSKVIYSLTVLDTFYHTETITDSIYIKKETSYKPYTGSNLSLTSFLSPVLDFDNLCAEDYLPVTIVIENTGEVDYDFSVDTFTLFFEIINPQQTKYTGYMPVFTGSLASGNAGAIELMAALPVIYSGKYELKAWFESSTDNIRYDNTLVYTYMSGRLGLPVETDFSGSFPSEFVTQTVNTSDKWTVITQGSGNDTAVRPVFGSGMLAFTGNMGAMTYLSTRQLELKGTTFPTLEFWYFHDTIESEDYMDVRISTDGGTTSSRLKLLLKQDATYGWKYYNVDLTNYVNGQCILILFEAMRMSPGTGSQYIDRIVINSQPDLKVSKIALPLQTACNLKNAEIEVILSTVTNQTIDLSDFSTSLAVEIPGYQVSPVPLQNRIDGISSDTIRILVPNLTKGSHNIKAYLTSPVDDMPINDTAYNTVNIDPKLSVTVKSITGNNYCLNKGIPAQQEIILQNIGNLDLTGIELSLFIYGDNSTEERVKETKTVDLHVGDSISYPFENTYTVPAEAKYQVQVFAWLGCDSVLVNATHATEECVDLDNISLVSIDKPVDGQTDTAGSIANIVVTIKNESDNKPYPNVTIMALIEDENGRLLSSRMEILSVIDPLATEQFTFTEPYTVPNDSVYFIRVYLNSEDRYPVDDTLTVKCYTVPKKGVGISSTGTINAFTLSQNVPNPANNSTRIDYSVPEAGEVVFHVHSISGQLLYSQTIDTKRGTNSIELNTTTFAAGVYFYSMQYKGQRLVKQLIIK